METKSQIKEHVWNFRDLIAKEAVQVDSIQIYREFAPRPLYRDLPCSPDAYTLKLKRQSGLRSFCLRVLPGERENLPLLIISPGYEGTLRDIPAETAKSFTSIFLSPLGYGREDGGQADELREYGVWPVLAHTVHGEPENYTDWLMDAACGIEWARKNTPADADKLVFAGCSQGGAMSILLGTIYRSSCMAVCADEPFLVGCSGVRLHDFIETVVRDPYQIVRMSQAERNLAAIDPILYAPLLEGVPVLICSGSEDRQCPEAYNERLFQNLPEGKFNRYVVHKGRVHGYSSLFHDTMMQFLRGELG